MLLIKNKVSFLFSKMNKNLKQHIRRQFKKQQQIKQQQLKNKPISIESINQWNKQPSALYWIIGFMSPSAIASIYYGLMQPFNSSFLFALDILQLQASVYVMFNYHRYDKKIFYATILTIFGLNCLPGQYALLAPSFITLTALILDTFKTKEYKKKQAQQDFDYAKMMAKIKLTLFAILFMVQLGKANYWVQQRKIKKLIEKYQIQNKS